MDSRNGLFVDRALTITRESALIAIATARPKKNMRVCERRLYHPETRSIPLLNQPSIFSRALLTSSPAASIMLVSVFLTRSLSLRTSAVSIAFLSSYNGLCGSVGFDGGCGGLLNVTLGGGGGVALVAPEAWAGLPGNTRSIKARAKFREGMYDGKVVPRM